MKNMEDQERFLNRLAGRLGRERRSTVTPPNWTDQPWEKLDLPSTREDMVKNFINNLAALDTRAEKISAQDVTDKIIQLIEDNNIESVAIQSDARLDHLNVPQALQSAGVLGVRWEADRSKEEQLTKEIERCQMGITFADVGLAETGTVVLFNGGDKGRLTSLLPPFYVAIIHEEQIVPRITQALDKIDVMAKYPNEDGSPSLPSCINFITGPSRSADIEMDLSLGVHGPGRVHVLVVVD